MMMPLLTHSSSRKIYVHIYIHIYIYYLASVGTEAEKTYMCIGMPLVANGAVKHANHIVSYTTSVPFFFLAVTMMVIEINHIVRGGEP